MNWTKTLLPEHVKDQYGFRGKTRVLTYGYSSRLFAGSLRGLYAQPLEGRLLRYLPQALYLHSYRLLEQLADLRAGRAEKRRVIFIAHSLGGLIVKSALVHASAAIGERDVRLKSIELLTVGVLFFGTPHRDTHWNSWSDLIGKMYRDAMPPSLRRDMKHSEDQADFFNLQIERYKSIESNFFNFSFYEGRSTSVIFKPSFTYTHR